MDTFQISLDFWKNKFKMFKVPNEVEMKEEEDMSESESSSSDEEEEEEKESQQLMEAEEPKAFLPGN